MVEEFSIDNLTESTKNIVFGYIAYAETVITDRALIDVKDGLKPGQRRALYTLKKKVKPNQMIKSNTVAGLVLEIHPHGEGSVYGTMIPMTQKYKGLQFPLIDGQGNWGGIHTTSPAAASRYTECKLSDYASELFGEMNGIKMIPNYDATTSEPELLPVSFPIALVNCSSGIAVGFRSQMPSFNFNDVIDLTIEYIRDGECHSVIVPDFTTGGYYIKNNKELSKLMRTGSANLKLRGKVQIVGKEITVTEFPYGKTIQGILKQIDKAHISGIKEAGNVDDYDHGVGLLIDCSAKNRVDEVLMSLYKSTDLQSNFSADMTVINDGKPVRMGVYDIIATWVKWRKEVLTKEYNYCIEGLKEELRTPLAFIEILKDKSKVDALVDLIYKKGDDEAIKFLRENYDSELVPADLHNWIVNRRVKEFRDGGKYREKYDKLLADIKYYEDMLSDLDATIINQLLALKSKYGSNFPRRTEITSTDYDFQSGDMETEMAKDMSNCTYVFKNGFLKKLRYGIGEKGEFSGVASDTLVAIDNRGRVLRVYCEDLPYNGSSELGTYLPKYFDLKETDDYRILWIGRLDGSTKMILYKDGNIGFLDTSEWVDVNRKVRVLNEGIATSIAYLVGAVVDSPECLFVVDSAGRIGFEYTDNIKRKHRTAKTRVFNLDKKSSITSYACMSASDAVLFLSNVNRYHGKLQFLEDENSFRGDASDLVLVY